MNKKIALLLLFLSGLLFSAPGFAFKLEPLYTTLSPSGSGAEKTFRVVNPGGKPIALEFRVTTRQQNIDGKESRQPADDLFMLYPPQAIIPPGKSQKIRVQWLGDTNPQKELAFRLVAEQLPVNLEPNPQTGLKMVMTMVGSIYIRPEGVQSHLTISGQRIVSGEQGNKLELMVTNRGTAHALLENLGLQLNNGQTLTGEAVQGAEGQNILSGSTRRFYIPAPTTHAQVTGIQHRQ
uniref:Pili assembly chaperone N-terminal domain-containing protein n=1 Tax=uncultured Thiotrichaceae bacterium TaxID=298394 RepID=A0A6S6SY43_9GAMM|nr:MAG: Unknown protein [uncultured Thiotrichaceae bacterium]